MKTAAAIWETARFPIYTGALAALWVLVVVMWVYMANYLHWFLTGRMELAVMARKGITPVVNLVIAVYWSVLYRNYLRNRRKQQHLHRSKPDDRPA